MTAWHRHIREITQNLPVDLDANIAAEFVFDENYWKRRCVEHFLQRNCQISEHGLTWKQLYFENFIQKVLQSLVSFLRNNAVRVWKNMNLKLRRSRWQYCCESLRLAKIISLRSRSIQTTNRPGLSVYLLLWYQWPELTFLRNTVLRGPAAC